MNLCAVCGKSVSQGVASCPECSGTVLPGHAPRHQLALYSPGDELGGRFRVEQVLGSGATGVVYGVSDRLLMRRSALKVLWEAAPESSPAFERLRREIRAAQKVQSPHLVTLYDLMVLDGRPALLMEWVEGENLRERIQRTGPLPADEAADIAAAVLEGLSALHAQGVVHRDVKSGNILLPADGGAKLGDFGLAKAEDMGATLTATGATLGTPGYMAPEVIRGEAATPRADLYGVGVVLFEMLTGRLPFAGSSALEVASKHLNAPPPLGLLAKGGTPRTLQRVVRRLLGKDPRDRFEGAAEVRVALRRGVTGFWLPRSTRRAAVGVGLALGLLGAVGAGLLSLSRQGQDLIPVIRERTLEVRNKAGKLLWSRELPRLVQSACAGEFGPGQTAAVACVTDWGELETAATPDERSTANSRIYLFGPDGQSRAEWPFDCEKPAEMSSHFRIRLAGHRFATGEGEYLVAHATHSPWYPSAIVVYDPGAVSANKPAGGIPNQSFNNSGHIYAWMGQDLDGDGREEMVYAGVNNRLYRAFFLAAGRVSFDAGSLSSPDQSAWGRWPEARHFYRIVRFGQRIGEGALSSAPAGILLSPQMGQERLLFGLDGAPSSEQGGAIGLSASAAADAADRIHNLCQRRDAKDWPGVETSARLLPEDGGAYSWLKALFRAHAALGLAQYDRVSPLLEGTRRAYPNMPPPACADQFQIDAAFLSGHYAECLSPWERFAPLSLEERPEIEHTAALAALYLEDDPLRPRRSFLGDQRFGYNSGIYEGLRLFLEGDASGADRVLSTPRYEDHPSFPLWRADLRLWKGDLSGARSILEDLARRFPDEASYEGEVGVYFRWKTGDRRPALLQQMEAFLAAKRRSAVTTPDDRAFLPFTLVRYAQMQSDAGHAAEAGRLLSEARRLAPKWWHKALGL